MYIDDVLNKQRKKETWCINRTHDALTHELTRHIENIDCNTICTIEWGHYNGITLKCRETLVNLCWKSKSVPQMSQKMSP